MRTSNHHPGEVDANWLGSFYYLFLGYVLDAGFDDEEDEDVIVPAGMVPVMTMHQSKGMDMIRQYYVAYSRAKYALILLGTQTHFSKQSVPLGPTRNWVRHRTNAL